MEYAIYVNGTRSSQFFASCATAVKKLMELRDSMVGKDSIVVSELSENSFAAFNKKSNQIYCYAVGGR